MPSSPVASPRRSQPPLPPIPEHRAIHYRFERILHRRAERLVYLVEDLDTAFDDAPATDQSTAPPPLPQRHWQAIKRVGRVTRHTLRSVLSATFWACVVVFLFCLVSIAPLVIVAFFWSLWTAGCVVVLPNVWLFLRFVWWATGSQIVKGWADQLFKIGEEEAVTWFGETGWVCHRGWWFKGN